MTPARLEMIMRLRGQGISNTTVLGAIERLPREQFAGMSDRNAAYAARAQPIDCGQSLLSPFATAVMMQAAELQDTHKVLLVGAGSGYMAAAISYCVRRVFGVERYKRLTEIAQAHIASLDMTNVSLRHGDGMRGWAGQAPYDRIIIAAEIEQLSKSLTDQLSAGGRIVTVQSGQLVAGRANSLQSIIPLSIPAIERGKSHAL